jgi:hypothetical protein
VGACWRLLHHSHRGGKTPVCLCSGSFVQLTVRMSWTRWCCWRCAQQNQSHQHADVCVCVFAPAPCLDVCWGCNKPVRVVRMCAHEQRSGERQPTPCANVCVTAAYVLALCCAAPKPLPASARAAADGRQPAPTGARRASSLPAVLPRAGRPPAAHEPWRGVCRTKAPASTRSCWCCRCCCRWCCLWCCLCLRR